jgi:predicted RNase H-like nuclease (RuvC/YqgF family)
LDGGNVASDLGVDGSIMLQGKLPPEVLAKIEEAKKQAEATGKKATSIAIGKAKEGEGKMQFRLQAAGHEKSEALKKEIDELRATINELKQQIEEMKK